jgi:hypothetical protein
VDELRAAELALIGRHEWLNSPLGKALRLLALPWRAARLLLAMVGAAPLPALTPHRDDVCLVHLCLKLREAWTGTADAREDMGLRGVWRALTRTYTD